MIRDSLPSNSLLHLTCDLFVTRKNTGEFRRKERRERPPPNSRPPDSRLPDSRLLTSSIDGIRISPMNDQQHKPSRILVAEDDPAINDVICCQLSRLGTSPEPAFSGTEAKRALDSEHFDLVITDLMLPGMTGEEVIKLIRNRDALVPIIVVSARTRTKDKVDVLGLGADDYLTKPFDLDELCARIQTQLRRSSILQLKGQDRPDNRDQLPTLKVGILNINPEQRALTIEDAEIPLTRTEFELLDFSQNPQNAFSQSKSSTSISGTTFRQETITPLPPMFPTCGRSSNPMGRMPTSRLCGESVSSSKPLDHDQAIARPSFRIVE